MRKPPVFASGAPSRLPAAHASGLHFSADDWRNVAPSHRNVNPAVLHGLLCCRTNANLELSTPRAAPLPRSPSRNNKIRRLGADEMPKAHALWELFQFGTFRS